MQVGGVCIGARCRDKTPLLFHWSSQDLTALHGFEPRQPAPDLRGLEPCPRSQAIIEEVGGL
eukprot:CAMPEP_0175463252 /NCGR_PEP_ID=MMETSP0095-20121207/69105_1 /TAXON_ID=311494 /ORGANISM="Alexandrium monilatum, Strain CCMP3105" /LENGTH=61 /DNA_ID=CAMNT_0016764381 /DNA_START=11 /DNA_END=193 /DNA_ORIENTATION=+